MVKGIFLVFLMVVQCANAQDLHFSLPFRTPLLLNPALTGGSSGNYRIVTAYKNQWSTIATPFQTIYASYDMRLLHENAGDNHLGLGLSFYRDKAGKTNMGLSQLNLSLAYEIKMRDEHFFSGGLQLGFVQRTAVYENIKWDSQYNGVGYDPLLPSGETKLPENHGYFDAGAGLNWNYVPQKKFSIKCGLAVSHLNKAKSSYFDDGTDKLNLRLLFHGHGELIINDQFTIIPKMLVVNKGAAFEFNTGGFVRYVTGERSKYTDAIIPSTVSIGVFYRYLDAIIPSVLYEYRRVLSIGVSYDLNVSPLKVASSARGGIEISLLFRGIFEKQHIKL